MSHVDRFELHSDPTNRKRSKSRKANGRTTIDNRPPWNNDTYIEGYDDVDENGRYRKKGGGGLPKSAAKNQDDLTKSWTETLRGESYDQEQK